MNIPCHVHSCLLSCWSLQAEKQEILNDRKDTEAHCMLFVGTLPSAPSWFNETCSIPSLSLLPVNTVDPQKRGFASLFSVLFTSSALFCSPHYVCCNKQISCGCQIFSCFSFNNNSKQFAGKVCNLQTAYWMSSAVWSQGRDLPSENPVQDEVN